MQSMSTSSMRTFLTAILKTVHDRKKFRICSLIHFFGGLEKQKINLDRDVGVQCKDWNESEGC